MTRCDRIEPLLPEVADGDAGPGEVATVVRHVQDCTSCRIQLARERRLSEAIEAICEIDVDDLFTASLMAKLPSVAPAQRRDRRGLKLAILATAAFLGGLSLAAPHPGWTAAWLSVAPPPLPADLAEPASASVFSLAQFILIALQSVTQAPLFAAAIGSLTWIALLSVVATLALGIAFGSTLIAVLANGLFRADQAAS